MPSSKQTRREKETYVTLIGVFLGVFSAVAAWSRERDKHLEFRPTDLATLGLATYRAGRLIAYDRVSEPLREPFTETKPDEYGAGENVEAEGAGIRKALGELISCPSCAGMWSAAAFVYGLKAAPGITRQLLAILAASGLADLLDGAQEALTWSSKAERKQAAP
jgi:hypothetical protein